MQNILIINLDGAKSVLYSGTLINSLRAYFPDSELSFLTYDEEKILSRTLPHITNFYLIEKKKIKTYLKGKIFPDAMAINSLDKTLSEICFKSWDQIIHAGSSIEGATVSSFLVQKNKSSNFQGLQLGSTKTLVPSNQWYLVQESLKVFKYPSLNSIEFLHLGNNLFFDPQIPRNNSDKKRVGIHLPNNPEDDFLPFQTLVELIECIKSSERHYPVLIVNFMDINKEYFTKLNRYFNYELDIVYPNFENIKKILTYLNLLISGDSLLKYIAQFEGTPLIELTDNLENSLIGPQNIILKKQNERIKGNDIFNCIEGKFFFNPGDFQTLSCVQDRLGYRFLRLNGSFSLADEIKTLMTRYLIGALYLQERDETIISEISELPQKDVLEWIHDEKSLASEISSTLLNTLRLLTLINESLSYKKDFILSLDQLLSYTSQQSLSSVPIMFFKYKIENSTNKEIKTFENHLFSLKDDLQVVVSSIRDLENQMWDKKKESLIRKAFGNRPLPNEELPQ